MTGATSIKVEAGGRARQVGGEWRGGALPSPGEGWISIGVGIHATFVTAAEREGRT